MNSARSLICCLLLMVAGTLAESAQARPPNIVYLMADELGYYELSCMGNPNIQTPNIDRLAAEGIRFTQALAGSSVCAPTRGVLMTGKHSGHTSVRSNGGGTPLRAEEETIASILKPQGYATGGFGKWGCGGRGSTGVPERHGFDQFLGYYDQVHAHTYYPPYLIRNSEEVPLANNHGGSNGATYSHYRIYEEAVRFIQDNRDRPFFCYLPFTPPHGIFDIPDEDPAWALYKDKPWPEQAKRYAAMVSMVDRQVGEIGDLLKKLGLDQDTIFFFCGDNGGNDYFRSPDHPRGFHGANVHPETGVEFRGTKGTLYEGGLRIPMIARWPGQIEPGRVSDLLWYFPDVLPTLAELAGAATPEDIDGISIVPELIGKAAAGRAQEIHEFLYWELGRQIAVRMGPWKALRRGEKEWELYNLDQDVSETHSLAATHPDILHKLQQVAADAHEDVREGVFHDRSLHERDRQAKQGFSKQKAAPRAIVPMPTAGMIPRKATRLVSFSSEETSNNRYARHAIDDDSGSVWHTRFSDDLQSHPHELILDLGAPRTIRGFRYLARQDSGWNGSIKDCEIFVGDTPDSINRSAARVTLKKTREFQFIHCEPVEAQFVRLHILSEVNGGPWASVADFGILGE